MQTFNGGAIRNSDAHKYDFEGFISPAVLERYGEYMHSKRLLPDGTLRDADNWQRGIPLAKYAKSLIRHVIDFWRLWRGYPVTDKDTGLAVDLDELCCAVMFNVMGFLHERLKVTN